MHPDVQNRRDRFYLQLAADASKQSPDPSTKNGAVLVCARPPQPGAPSTWCADCNRYSTVKCDDGSCSVTRTEELNKDRDVRLAWIEHAERNVIFSALRQTDAEGRPFQVVGSTMYCPFAACADCARAIVLTGVSRIVRLGPDAFAGYPERWRKSIAIADDIMAAGGVKVENFTQFLDRTYFLDGKEWRV